MQLLRSLVGRAALALAALIPATASQASSYTESFTNVTFYYSGFTTFNDAPSDGQAHTFFSGDVAYASGIAEQSGTFRMTGDLSFELVLDAQDGNRCDSAQIWFGYVVGPQIAEPLGGPQAIFCQPLVQTIYGVKNMHIDSGVIGLAPGPTSAYFSDLGSHSFPPAPVPEPSTYALLLAGLWIVGIGMRSRGRKVASPIFRIRPGSPERWGRSDHRV